LSPWLAIKELPYFHLCISGGQAKTLMFVHISPEPDALGETLSTLKFAERVSTVELGAARVNKDNSEVKDLKEQVLTLDASKHI
jgi:kinesin family protein C2/C3